MSRTLTAEMLAHLENPALTLAICILVERKDGQIFGFTSLDRKIVAFGDTYKPRAAVTASAIRQVSDTGVDNMDLVGATDGQDLKLSETRAKLYEAAKITIFLVNYEDLTMGSIVYLRGEIGRIVQSDAGDIKIEVRADSSKLKQQVGYTCGPSCWVKRLGNSECRADLTGLVNTRTVVNIDEAPYNIVLDSDANVTNYYTNGIITGVTGLNAGIEREIKKHILAFGDAHIDLKEKFPFEIEVGDTFTLEKGCNRSPEACKTFQEIGTGDNNIKNFRGFMFMPGNKTVIEMGRAPKS